MNIKDIMNPNVDMVSASTTLQDAAARMAHDEMGFLLVGDTDQVKGIVTDRDIVLRALGKGRDLSTTTINDILTGKLLYCLESQNVEDVANYMSEQQVRRMPVLNEHKRLVGVITIGDTAQYLNPAMVSQVLSGVTSEIKAA
ncbi:CBS domain-containing protein [Marinimicrobium sp. ABcell2]|uniref:CBS domain-containing protein n=1 Tax=Marinimicrobium sp. ABcell2 TaxID=3069751 RepID=UPI0027ADEADB|nr:CBS domain-containing protein [Marinimicrobium sp. ABcell2]MDQ2078511.1 CBS domain-containing protein [Marinimicrobium sp. ABcell2]